MDALRDPRRRRDDGADVAVTIRQRPLREIAPVERNRVQLEDGNVERGAKRAGKRRLPATRSTDHVNPPGPRESLGANRHSGDVAAL